VPEGLGGTSAGTLLMEGTMSMSLEDAAQVMRDAMR
jgi:hypothetical protein